MPRSRQWVLRQRASDLPILSGPEATFALAEKDVGSPTDGQVLIKTLYLSNDPSQRGWIDVETDDERLYLPKLSERSPMPSFILGEVIATKAASLAKSDLVRAWVGWSEYATVDARLCTKLPPLPNRLTPTHHLGALGLTGLTALFGM